MYKALQTSCILQHKSTSIVLRNSRGIFVVLSSYGRGVGWERRTLLPVLLPAVTQGQDGASFPVSVFRSFMGFFIHVLLSGKENGYYVRGVLGAME